MTVNPQHVQGANALGYLLTEDNRDLKFARELLERAYRAEPLNPYILDSMGWLNFREGRYRAAAEFTTASLKRLWDIEVAGHLVEIYAAQGKKQRPFERSMNWPVKAGTMQKRLSISLLPAGSSQNYR